MTAASDLYRYVSKRDFVRLLELIDRALATGTESQFRDLLVRTAELIPLRNAHVAVAQLDAKGAIVKTTRRIVLDFPVEWFKTYRERNYFAVDPVAHHLVGSDAPVIWSQVRKHYRNRTQRHFYGAAADYGLVDGFSFGARFHRSPSASFFVCEGVDLARHRRHLLLTRYLAPHLHTALSKVHLGAQRTPATLTRREVEVLNWAKFGKTNWEISLQLCISARAVKFHIENAMRKLNATNRTQAIAVALSQGLIEWG
jgi:DNA-binding CsgD family transcriptional regulator